jgi:hypothetical protein
MDAWTSAGSIHDKADALERELAGRGVSPALAEVIARAYLERGQVADSDSFFTELADQIPAGAGGPASLDGEAQARLILTAAIIAAPDSLAYAAEPLKALLEREPVDEAVFANLEQRIRVASSLDPAARGHAPNALKLALYYGKRYATFLGQQAKDPTTRWPLWVSDGDLSRVLIDAVSALAIQRSLPRALAVANTARDAFSRPTLSPAPAQAPAPDISQTRLTL